MKETIKTKMQEKGINDVELAKACAIQLIQIKNYLYLGKCMRSDNLEKIFNFLEIKLV